MPLGGVALSMDPESKKQGEASCRDTAQAQGPAQGAEYTGDTQGTLARV